MGDPDYEYQPWDEARKRSASIRQLSRFVTPHGPEIANGLTLAARLLVMPGSICYLANNGKYYLTRDPFGPEVPRSAIDDALAQGVIVATAPDDHPRMGFFELAGGTP